MKLNQYQDFVAEIKTYHDFRDSLDATFDTYYYLLQDGGAVCHKCAKREHNVIASAIAGENDPQWRPTLLLNNLEDHELTCDHCNSKIETEYEA